MLSEGHTFLLLEVGDHARYAQFATHDGSWLRGEVVGAVQVPDSPLSPSEEAASVTPNSVGPLDSGGQDLAASVFAGLARLNPGTGRVEPYLAERWEQLEDGRTILVKPGEGPTGTTGATGVTGATVTP